MSAAAPWSVKGIDPKAREIAKDLARRQGLTLGDWLNRMILEDTLQSGDPDLSLSPATSPIASAEFDALRDSLERLNARVESAEHRSTLAISGIDQTVLGLLSRLETAEREQVAVAARFEGAVDEIKVGQSRAQQRLDKAEATAVQPRSVEALRALEAALGKVAAHLYDSETRTRESLTEMRADLTGLTQRVEAVDEAGAAPSQVMIDGVVSRIVERLEEAEARTFGAIRGLEVSVGDFDQRLKAAESRDEGPEQRLEELASELLRNFDTVRDDIAEKLEVAADARFQAMERSFREVTGQVRAAEQRSTQAMERVGREVLHVAEALGRRMEGVESRSAEALEQVGGDVARIADVMETRLRKADQIQAESLERLGVEIARITERLADRIANAERRSAQAIDDVGEQVSRITERLNQRHERTSTDLADRIRQSEERTARLLEEARDKIDQRLAGTERRLVEQVAPAAATPAEDRSSLFAEPDLPPGPFEPQMFSPTALGRGVRPGAGYVPLAESLPPEPERSPFEGDDFDAAEMFDAFEAEAEAVLAEAAALAPEIEQESVPDEEDDEDDTLGIAPAPDVEAEAQDASEAPEPEAQAQPFARTSTRDLIAQARAAARAAAATGEPGKAKSGLFSGFSLGIGGAKGKKPGIKLRTGLMMAAAAAVLGLSTAAVTLFSAQWVGHPKGRASGARNGLEIDVSRTGPSSAAPVAQAAVALAPQVGGALPTVSVSTGGMDAAGLYTDAVRRIEGKDDHGVTDLRKAALLGYAPAQFYLAKLYEAGQSGVPKDVGQARLWTERAASAGDRKAMHNLALYYFEGTGGPKNAAAAAQWFRKAADMGLVDSQYNLARLYEGGFGVTVNMAEAYKWYLVAGREGDGESRSAADRLKALLSIDAVKAAERAAQSYRPQTELTSAQIATALGSPRSAIAAAQRALNRLGYYKGPTDGVSSPALKMAIGSYQRDQGLGQTGALDQSLIDRFAKLSG